MDLKSYLLVLWRRRWILAGTTGVGLLVALSAGVVVPPEYTATTTLYISTAGTGSVDSFRYDPLYSDRLLNTYSALATSPPVLKDLAQQLGTTQAPRVTVELPANTELLMLEARATDPGLAARAADVLAVIVRDRVRAGAAGSGTTQETIKAEMSRVQADLEQARQVYTALADEFPLDSPQVLEAPRSVSIMAELYATLLSQYERARIAAALLSNSVAIVTPAAVPTTPSWPNVPLIVGLALGLGLLGGLGLAFLFEKLDPTLYNEARLTDLTALPVLARIPAAAGPVAGGQFGADSPQEEGFCRLRTVLLALEPAPPRRTLLVTSADPGEGKSTVVANLARVCARAGRHVLVVDANLRHPVQHRLFDLPNGRGLSNVLQHDVSAGEVVVPGSIPGLYILPSGPTGAQPADLPGLSDLRALLAPLTPRFDLILVDAPAVLAAADTTVIVPAVDGVLLVVGCGQATRDALQEACRDLASTQARIVGIIANRAGVPRRRPPRPEQAPQAAPRPQAAAGGQPAPSAAR
jgi:non-specific protein-tyrosine kinase